MKPKIHWRRSSRPPVSWFTHDIIILVGKMSYHLPVGVPPVNSPLVQMARVMSPSLLFQPSGRTVRSVPKIISPHEVQIPWWEPHHFLNRNYSYLFTYMKNIYLSIYLSFYLSISLSLSLYPSLSLCRAWLSATAAGNPAMQNQNAGKASSGGKQRSLCTFDVLVL